MLRPPPLKKNKNKKKQMQNLYPNQSFYFFKNPPSLYTDVLKRMFFQPIIIVLSFKQSFSGLISESLKPVLLKANFRKSSKDTSGFLTTLLCKYLEMMMQQPATLAANQQHLLQYHQTRQQ